MEYLTELSDNERQEAQIDLEYLELINSLENSPLSQKLKAGYDTDHHRRRKLNSLLPLKHLEQGQDALGCVIASCRMLLTSQGLMDPGQERARQIVEKTGMVNQSGWTQIDKTVAESLGVENVDDLATYDWQESKVKREDLWTKKLTTLIDQGNLVVASMPMQYIYPGSQSKSGHAFVVRGMRYDENGLSFEILDPLGQKDHIPSGNFVKGMMKDMFPESHMITTSTQKIN